MGWGRRFFYVTGIAVALAVLTGCTYQAALQQLPAAERATFDTYHQMMTSKQIHTYLSKSTPAERNAYLEHIGMVQRFEALDPLDRQAVRDGYPKKGMSAEAMRFLWGEPYHTEGREGHYEQWFYQGSSGSLAEYGNRFTEAGTIVVVHLVDGRVLDWLETVPSTNDDDGGDNGDRKKN